MKRYRQPLHSLFVAVVLLTVSSLPPPASAQSDPIIAAAQGAERELDARVGLAIRDTGTGALWQYNVQERFPMASTFKVLVCAALLAKHDAGQEDINRKVAITKADLVTYSPVTETWMGSEVSLSQLCESTMRTSDNAAANKVLEALGGPSEVTRFLRAIGDEISRLDRWETALNEAKPGDERDTTTPAAMATTLQKIVLGDVLSPASKATLLAWLEDNEVGGPLLRSGIPADWRIGDRTGAGGYGSRGVVAITTPPGQAPLIVAIYITQTEASMEQRSQAIADIGRALAQQVLEGR